MSAGSGVSGLAEAPEPQSGAPTPEKLDIVRQGSFATPSPFVSPYKDPAGGETAKVQNRGDLAS